MLAFVAICLIVAGVNAGPGSCPDAQPMDNFDLKSYAQGRWFEIARYAEIAVEQGADCVFFDYVQSGANIVCTLREIVDKNVKIVNTTVVPAPGAVKPGELYYSAIRGLENATVMILDSDYKNYSIFYYCTFDDSTQSKLELAWIKSRAPSMKPEVKAVVDKFLESHPLIDPKKFVWDHFTHEDCLIDV